MTQASPTSPGPSSPPRAPLPAQPGAEPLKLHVIITPTANRRALLGSLMALSMVREPRMRVTAQLPPGTAGRLPSDPRFQLLAEGATPAQRDLPELDPTSVLVILRAGALPPRGWLETLTSIGRETGARAVAARPWHPAPGANPESELRRWERLETINRQSCYRQVEDRAQLETPLLAIFRPHELREALESYWRDRAEGNLCLRNESAPLPQRILVAKALLVWQEPGTPALHAGVHCSLPTLAPPTTTTEADALMAELHTQLEATPRPELRLRLAQLAIIRGDRPTALRQARRCLESWPECAEAKLLLARALTGEERLAAARHLIEELLDSGPMRPRERAGVFACLANIWLRAGDPSQAQPCLDVALSIDPEHAVARYGMARIALAAGRFGEALGHLETSLRGAPLHPDMHFELGRARVLAGHDDQGRQALERALELDPDHSQARALLERLEPPR